VKRLNDEKMERAMGIEPTLVAWESSHWCVIAPLVELAYFSRSVCTRTKPNKTY